MKATSARLLLPALLLTGVQWVYAEPEPVRMQSEASLVGRSVDPLEQGALFAGEWRMNRKQSDDPQKLIKEKMAEARRGRAPVDAQGKDAEGAVGVIPRLRSGSSTLSWRMKKQEKYLTGIPTRLTLAYESPALLVTADDGPTRTWYTDSRGGSVSAGGDTAQETVTAGWEGATLVVERISAIGPASVEQYRIDSKGQLHVSVVLTIPGVATAMNYELIYDRIAAPPVAQTNDPPT